MKRFRLLVMLSILIWSGSSATVATQADNSDSLAQNSTQQGFDPKSPSPSEYLTAVPQIVTQWQAELEESTSFTYYGSLYETIQAEVSWRFPQLFQENSAQIISAYQSLTGYAFLDQGWWNQQIILALLRENEIDLSTSDFVRLGIYELNIIPEDFDADGTVEWLIWVESETYQQYLIVKQDADGTHHLVNTPLPWFAPGYGWGSTPSGGLETLRVEDINRDGLPEWIVAFGGVGANDTNAGSLYVLAWRDGALVEIAPRNWDEGLHYFASAMTGAPIIRPDVRWELPNLDTDPAREIRQTQEFTDNWTCTFLEIRSFDWRETEQRYVFAQETDEFPDSFGCTLRQAQQAMWDHDLTEAIDLYERSLQQARDAAGHDDLIQYVQLRLALAYSLNGAYGQASDLLNDLRLQEPQSDLMASFITGLTDTSGDQPLGLCEAIYNVAAYANPRSTTEIGYLGTTERIVLGPFSVGYPSPNAARAGCDLRWALETYFAEHPLSSSRSPVDQLIELGLNPVDPTPLDLDRDGKQEWLVWIAVKVPPTYFAPVGSQYQVTFPDMRMLNEWSYVTTTELPGKTGLALVNRYKLAMHTDGRGLTNDAFQWPPQYQCYPQAQFDDLDRYNTQGGFFRMWRLDQGTLVPIADFSICDERTLDQFFPNGPNELYGWASITPELEYIPRFAPAKYVWDAVAQIYQPPAVETIEGDLHIPPPQNENRPTLDQVIQDVQKHWYRDMDWAASIGILESALNNLDLDESSQTIYQARYWYGMILERSRQPNRAGVQYASIYAASPDSAWGMLSKLHLAIVR